jgi:hypothetical protein
MKTIISLIILLCASVAVTAQQPVPSPNQPGVQPRCCVRRFPKRVLNRAAATATTQQAPSDFFVGEAKVDVTKDETVVRLAMAQHGSVLIELPANDGPRYIIPGDPEMATIDEKALERNKRAIVVRPGSLFVPPLPNRKTRTPAATVTAQMRSGLVVTFLFYPVEDLAQNVHRCVLSYNRDEVVARRRAAGLPVNLDTNPSQERRTETGQSTAPTSISVETNDEAKPSDTGTSAKPTITIQFDKQPKTEESQKDRSASSGNSSAPSNAETRPNETSEKINRGTLEALARAIKKPKQFKRWTKPVHGLTLAANEQGDPKENFRVAILAVKNVSSDVLKISPGSPDLSLEMVDAQGKPVNVQAIKRLHLEISEAPGAIAAGATVYYAIAYSSPVLGAHQQLKIAVSQTAAADEPASLTLAGNNH